MAAAAAACIGSGMKENMWDCHVEGVRVDDVISVCHSLAFADLMPLPDMIKYHCIFTYVKVKQYLLRQNSWKGVYFCETSDSPGSLDLPLLFCRCKESL